MNVFKTHKFPISLLGGFVAALFSSSAFANLIPIGAIPSTGNGLGAVNSVVTFQNTGTEVGAVGLTTGGAFATGASVAFGIGTVTPPTHEQTGAGNNVY